MKKIVLSILVFFLFTTVYAKQKRVVLKNMQLEMRVNPEGVLPNQVRFSWMMDSKIKNIKQTSYRILVANSKKELKLGHYYWDSGLVYSDESHLVSYKGKPLLFETTYYWKVFINTNKTKEVSSSLNHFSTALNPNNWKAFWIGFNKESSSSPFSLIKRKHLSDKKTRLPARYLRKKINLNKSIKEAMIYVSGVGSYYGFINGKKISNDVFAPLPTNYDKKVFYNTYNVSRLLRRKKNIISFILGNGRFYGMRSSGLRTYGLPRLKAQLEIKYCDGTKETIITDTTWKVTDKGPIISNNEFDGEEYDQHLEMIDWKLSKYKEDYRWRNADIIVAPKGQLKSQSSENIQVMEKLLPKSIKKVADDTYILDMGQNMVGWLKIRLYGYKNKPITLRFAEVLAKDKLHLYVDNLRTAEATDVYLPAVDGSFKWQPQFTYHGFRFVEVKCPNYMPKIKDFEGVVIYDKMKTIGSFQTSNKLINQLYSNAYWGIRGNYRGMPTDCPQRDERQGWLGDRATGAIGESFIFKNVSLYNKWLDDIVESMSKEGSISVVSPFYWTFYNDDVTWPSAYFYIVNMLYRQYGDKQVIHRHYPMMKKWINHIVNSTMKDYIITRDIYGDWCMPPEKLELIHSKDPNRKTNGEILSTTVFYSILKLMEEFAILEQEQSDLNSYKELSEKIRMAYNRKYFNKMTGQYGNNTVTANLLSLELGLVPKGFEDKVFKNIYDKTTLDFNEHVSVGVLGIQHLMRGLTHHNQIDLAWKIASNTTYPSWGYMIENGATTIWELWNGNTANPAMNSRNHVMLLGDLLIWFYEDLAGIKNAPNSSGFKHILMQPTIPKKLNHVKAAYQSPYGIIKSEWTRKKQQMKWTITIPANTTATVYMPKGFNFTTKKKSLGSGTYSFETDGWKEAAYSIKNKRMNFGLIPTPQYIENKGKILKIPKKISVSCDLELKSAAEYLIEKIEFSTGYSCKRTHDKSFISLRIDSLMNKTPGSYTLNITSKSIVIIGNNYNGVINGISTLRQLLPPEFERSVVLNKKTKWKVPCVYITDAPCYQYRGIMLDVARHFFDKDEIKKILDRMALYKLNKFHWHLTDNEAWRIEIKRFPKLTKIGAWRKINNGLDNFLRDRFLKDKNSEFRIPEKYLKIENGDTLYGGYYTQKDIKEIIKYATKLGIDIIPEIDMPGHFNSASNVFPDLICPKANMFSSPICVGNDKSLIFCKQIYEEIFKLFPFKYIHIGGDEVGKENWKKCPLCQKRIKEEGLSNEEELQSWFILSMESFFNKHGKKLIGWDEITKGGVSNKSIIMWWLGNPKTVIKATKNGNKIISTPNQWVYFDHAQTNNSLKHVFDFNPIPFNLSKKYHSMILGTQGNIWSEYIPTMERLDYMSFPKILCLSEVCWVPNNSKDWIFFDKKIKKQLDRLDIMEINYRIPYMKSAIFNKNRKIRYLNVPPEEWICDTVKMKQNPALINIKLEWKGVDIRYTDNGEIPTMDSKLYKKPIKIDKPGEYIFATFHKNGKRGEFRRVVFIKEN